MSNHPLTIYLHIPKTGGTTLSHILRKQYESNKIYDHGYLKGEKKDFNQLLEEEKKNIKAVCGHFSYGVHQFFPQPSRYFTMLRDPVDRVISSYYFLKNFKGKGYELVKTMTLEQFVEKHPEAHNLQTLMLSGLSLERNIEKAKDHLRKFPVIGITERFNESVFLIKKEFNWQDIDYQRLNITKNRLLKQEISDTTIRLIERHNLLDIELYHLAQQLFYQKLNALSGAEQGQLKQYLRNFA